MTVAKLGSNGPMNVASDNALPRMRNHLQCHKSRSRRWRQHTPVAHHVSQIARGRTETRVHVPGGGNPDPAVFPGPQHRDLAEPAPLVAVPADMQDHLRHFSVGTTSRTASGCRAALVVLRDVGRWPCPHLRVGVGDVGVTVSQ